MNLLLPRVLFSTIYEILHKRDVSTNYLLHRPRSGALSLLQWVTLDAAVRRNESPYGKSDAHIKVDCALPRITERYKPQWRAEEAPPRQLDITMLSQSAHRRDCREKHRDEKVVADGEAKGYPKTVNFKTLKSRIYAMKSELDAIASGRRKGRFAGMRNAPDMVSGSSVAFAVPELRQV